MDDARLMLADSARLPAVDLHLTVVDRFGVATDATVLAEPGTSWGEVSADLSRLVDGAETSAQSWFLGALPLAATMTVGVPPLLSGAVLSRVPSAAQPSHPLWLDVISGPDAGRSHPLRPGLVVVGRGEGCDLRIADPLLSRRHLVIELNAQGIRVRDLGSANGTVLSGRVVIGEATTWSAGTVLSIGSSTLAVRESRSEPTSVRPDGRGGLLHNRAPRSQVVRPQVLIPATTELLGRSTGSRLTWSAVLAPMIAAGVLLGLGIRGPMLVFVVVSPLISLMTAAGAVLTHRLRRRRRSREHVRSCSRTRAALRGALEEEQRYRQAEAPDLALIARTARTHGSGLFARGRADHDFLDLRIGTATLPAQTRWSATDPRTEALVLAGTALTVSQVPLICPLATDGVLGIAGGRDEALALGRSLLLQLATLHGPDHLTISLVAPDRLASHWAWSRWLPHRSGASLDLSEIAARTTTPGTRDRGGSAHRPLVVVVDQARELTSPHLTRVLDVASSIGVYVLCVAESVADLPAQCRAVVEICGPRQTGVRLSRDGVVTEARLDGISGAVAQAAARALAPLVPAGTGSVAGLPPRVDLAELLPRDAVDPIATAARWGSPGRLAGVVGRCASGPMVLDLDRDGPHALVAGTTGSGKSEFLRTLVTSLALQLPPTELSLLLVDYKGGSTFTECLALPHVVGMLTDLDPQGSRRALTSLSAELRRRERLLAEHGVRDLHELRSRAPADHGLPRLLIVVDEFAALVEELPGFVPGLVDLARRGRSLGIHLILATQRPGGVVNADIRGNASLRVALRLSEEDTHDVLGTPAPGMISAATPGRAFVRTAIGVTQVQLATLGTDVGTTTGPARVRRWPGPDGLDDVGGGAATEHLATAAGERPCSALVTVAIQAADLLGLATPSRPWLPPLPEHIALEELADPDSVESAQSGEALRVPFALADEPARQRRATVVLPLGTGQHLAVVGGARCGRSTALRTLIASATTLLPAASLHVHVLDGAGELADVDGLDQCGTLVGPGAEALADRLLSRLDDEVSRRRRGPQPSDSPHLLLIVDGWDAWAEAFERIEHGRGIDTLVRLLRDGAAVGFTAAISGGRSLLIGRLASAIPRRLLLGVTDPADLALVGMRPADLPARMPPGRGVLHDGRMLQVAAPRTGWPDRVDPLARGAHRAGMHATEPHDTEPHRRPLRLVALPRAVDHADLPAAASGGAVIGLAGDHAAPLEVPIPEESMLVTGPARSGKTTTLTMLAAGWVAAGHKVCVISARGGPLAAVAGAQVLAAQATCAPPDTEVVIVDDVDLLPSTATQEWLRGLIEQRAEPSAPRAVLGADVDAAATSFAGPLAALRRRRPSGLVLCPRNPLDGELLGVRCPASSGQVLPGRGVAVLDGVARPVQVAAPTSGTPEPPVAAPVVIG